MSAPNIAKLRTRLERFTRLAWLPRLVNRQLLERASRFGGTPKLRAGEEWPCCANCGARMSLFLQLGSAELPPAMRNALAPTDEACLLQLFYCTSTAPHCESVSQAYLPHARSTLLRLVPAADLVEHAHAEAPAGSLARTIVSWSAREDLPGAAELSSLGVDLTEEEADALFVSDVPHSGDKLGGWPHWVQGIEYPACRQCGAQMHLLFQLASERGVAWQFGDAGIGHITQCSKHRDELAFGWACV